MVWLIFCYNNTVKLSYIRPRREKTWLCECEQHKYRSACTSVQSDKRLCNKYSS